MSAELLAPGTRLGRYEIVSILGAGAMGQVYLARDVSLNRRVAIKALGDAHLHRHDLRARFAREARAVASISHPNVVQIFDISEDRGRPYFVMEYLKGTDVDALLKKRGRLTVPEAVAIGLSSALGLAEAASTGVVHRDVKPANLFLTDRGVVKVTDFGLAKGFELGANLTGDGVTLGTPDYMPPEQGQGLPVDTRADIYALGATLFHLLAGRPPFRGSDERIGYAEVVMRHIKQPAPHVRDLAPQLDPELAALVDDMLAKDPGQRPTYDDVISRLREVAQRINAKLPQLSRSGEAGSTSESIPIPVTHEVTGPTVLESPSSTELPAGRVLPGWAVALSVGSLLVFVSALALYLYSAFLPTARPAKTVAYQASADMGARPTRWRERLEQLTPPDSVLLISTVTGPIAVAKLPVSPEQVRRLAPTLGHTADLGKMSSLDGVAAGGLSLQTARLITQKLGGRLPTHVEWALIEASHRVRTWPEACEWVDDGPTEDTRCFKGHHEVQIRPGRKPKQPPNTIFRVVRMLEAETPAR